MPSIYVSVILCCFVFLAANASSAPKEKEPEPINCLECHSDLAPEKGAHPAVAMGCQSCHSAIDASDIPHKKNNNIAKGLSADQPDLCYGCHDQSLFEKKSVHPALSMGCTSCHNPHASVNAKLLIAEPPDLCYNCHDKALFTKKSTHPTSVAGWCTLCHNPHSADYRALLSQPVNNLCLDCHDMTTGRNMLAGISYGHIHPLGGKADPVNPKRELSCVSCHNPHSSNQRRQHINEDGPVILCHRCHSKISVKTDRL